MYLKFSFSVASATLQMLNSHVWLSGFHNTQGMCKSLASPRNFTAQPRFRELQKKSLACKLLKAKQNTGNPLTVLHTRITLKTSTAELQNDENYGDGE